MTELSSSMSILKFKYFEVRWGPVQILLQTINNNSIDNNSSSAKDVI